MFSAAAGKDVLVAGVLLQEKTTLLYERLFPDATMPFSSSTGFRSQFTTSQPAERSRERHSTLYYSVANQEVVQVQYDHSWLQSLARDQLNVVFALFYWPCPCFRPPGDYFRTTKMDLCLLKPKAFSWQGNQKKMLTRYEIVLQYFTTVALFYQSCLRLCNTVKFNGLFACPD